MNQENISHEDLLKQTAWQKAKLKQLCIRYNIPLKVDPRVVVSQPYTFVEIMVGGRSFYGFSKCSPRDKWDPNIGYAIALSRALRHLAM